MVIIRGFSLKLKSASIYLYKTFEVSMDENGYYGFQTQSEDLSKVREKSWKSQRILKWIFSGNLDKALDWVCCRLHDVIWACISDSLAFNVNCCPLLELNFKILELFIFYPGDRLS